MKMTLNKVKELQAQLKDTVGPRPAEASAVRVLVGMATCGLASGAGKVMEALKNSCQALNLEHVELISTGCIGLCQYEPIVEVTMPGQEKVTYVKMTPDKVGRVVAEHIIGGKPVTEFTIGAAAR